MKKDMARKLLARADEIGRIFSNTDRGGNYDNETFTVNNITVLSENTAVVTFLKTPTNKKAVAWLYFINSQAKPRWEYFFITYSHLVGMNRVAAVLHQVEQHNFAESIK